MKRCISCSPCAGDTSPVCILGIYLLFLFLDCRTNMSVLQISKDMVERCYHHLMTTAAPIFTISFYHRLKNSASEM